MEHIQEVRVLYADTDSYGVVWHGAYTKWFEAARVEFTEKLGIDLETLESNKIVFPVVELNIRYKSSARMNERLVIKTKIRYTVFANQSETMLIINNYFVESFFKFDIIRS